MFCSTMAIIPAWRAAFASMSLSLIVMSSNNITPVAPGNMDSAASEVMLRGGGGAQLALYPADLKQLIYNKSPIT